ncbi:exported hypothetical protein [Magnetospirillum sp. LM-5]|uniref:hypothetical protein n=1 Tax=Magnetospirillum sp. LM-5 TaxID=2681466 RepID=UPI00137C491D|nr:hypothetical protein [Magnetospirillum sp. LM-5]CAA7624173.1 exported hypothetical protein [Magnetospirillum sp. LM-5]
MKKVAFCPATIAVLAMALPALAAENGFSGVRVITMTEATSTCIGVPRTPLCAAETFLACSLRNDEAMCDLVGAGPFGPRKAIAEKYKFVASRVLTKEDYQRVDRAEWAKPGTVSIVLQTSSCFKDGTCSPFERYTVLVSEKNGKWIVVSWNSAADDEDFAD